MASEKTLKLREQDEIDARRITILSQGPSFAEKPGVVANRAARLGVEHKLGRSKRMELRKLRAIRMFTGVDPPQPKWAIEGEDHGRRSTSGSADSSGDDPAEHAFAESNQQAIADACGQASEA